MASETRKIQTLRFSYLENNISGKLIRKVGFFSGYDKKSQTIMRFDDNPEKAIHLQAETAEQKIDLLQEAREYAFGYTFNNPISPQLEWVELEIVTVVTSTVTPMDLEDEAMDILRDRLLRDLTPVEIKALGLQKQAVYLKLATP